MLAKKYIQTINWFPEWHGVFAFRWHKEKSSMAYIYDWFLGLGFWEIRKWHTLTDEEKHELRQEKTRRTKKNVTL